MAPPKKAPERRQRTNTTDVGTVTVLPSMVVAKASQPDVRWAPPVAESWSELWSSPLAGLIKPTDVPALRRLFEYRHQLLAAQANYDDEPMTVGSMGQPVLSPWAAEIHRLEAVVQKLEEKFGLTPLARLRLGVTFESGVSLASQNAALLDKFRASQGG